jgi:2-oxoisovalerate dehydrogenase E1 component alpha subunit
MLATVAEFRIDYTRHLDPDGQPVGTLPDWGTDPDALVPLYRSMVLTRTFDNKAIALQRTGRLGTYASTLGQEAVSATLAAVMHADDVLVPFYRDTGTLLARGVTMTEILQYWGGDERGMDYRAQRQDFPINVPIATQLPHAMGVAYAFKLRDEPRVAVCTCGDGATSKGDFHEALNFAGIEQLPVLVVVVNNQWAISVPRSRQSAAATLAQKAVAAGIHGEQVDGNDAIAMVEVTRRLLERARAGQGPALLETLTYRLSDHTTADDASRYRSEEELEAHRREEPIGRLRRHLENLGAWSDKQEKALHADCAEQVDAAVRAYLDIVPEPPGAMFDHLYAELPAALRGQRESLDRGAGHG